MDAKIRVMLADASAEFRLLLREALEETGEFQVVGETGDGSQVAALAAETHPQILLMDTMLPVLDGIGVLRQSGRGRSGPAPSCCQPSTTTG